MHRKQHSGDGEPWIPGFPFEWYPDFGYWDNPLSVGKRERVGANSSPESDLCGLDSDRRLCDLRKIARLL